jgi:transposase
MAGRRTTLMDIRNLLRHLQASSNVSAIQRATGLNRRTIMRYRDWATTHHLLDRPLPPLEELQQFLAASMPPAAPPQTLSSVEPYRAVVEQLYADGVEGSAILQRLKERGYTGTLSSIYRFLRHLDPRPPMPPVRLEREPGTEAQVDFGYAGRMLDPTTGALRKTWAFVMTLAYSRHQYVEFVFDQTLPTWIGLHQHAFTFFGGVPQRVVLDNLKAGIVKACWDDQQVQTTYRECAEHYGFLIAPLSPAHTRTQGQGRTRRRPLRQTQFSGRANPDDPHPGKCRCARVVPHHGRLAYAWHHQSATAHTLPDTRALATQITADRPL